MKGRRYGKQVTRRLLTSLLGVAACFAVTAPAFSEEGSPFSSGETQTGSGTSVPQPPAEKPAAVPEGAAGMKVYIDPKTGAILREPAPGTVPLQLTPREQNALSTSHQGLVEVPSSVPGGGVKLDLQGRFQSPLFVTIDANGKVKMQHLDEPHENHVSHDKNSDSTPLEAPDDVAKAQAAHLSAGVRALGDGRGGVSRRARRDHRRHQQ